MFRELLIFIAIYAGMLWMAHQMIRLCGWVTRKLGWW